MIVICKACETAFNIDESLIKKTGSRARCSKCSHEFSIYSFAIQSEPEHEFAFPEPDTVSNEQVDTPEASPGLLNTDPIPFGLDEEDATSITVADGDGEPDLPSEDAGSFQFSVSGDDVEEIVGSDLPDLEGFDEYFLSEDGLIPDDESSVSNPEAILEEDEKTPAAANPETKISETDEIDLTDLDELINRDDLPDAGKSAESISEEAGDVFEIEDEDIAGSAHNADPSSGSDVLDISDLEKTVTAEFIENDSAGRLLVVREQVLNEYDHPRSFIKITAKLYQKGDKLAKTSEVYCGNVIAEQDLAGMEFSAISRRLQNRFGDRRLNLRVRSGNAIPFMIVFNQLPDNLDEYSVEVAESIG